MEAPCVQIDTPMGSFTVELYHQHAPNTCKNFESLAAKGYYDGTIVSMYVVKSIGVDIDLTALECSCIHSLIL